MRSYPLFLKLAGRRTPIVGGGEAARRKGRLVAAAGARPVFIAPQIDSELKREFGAGADYVCRAPRAADFEAAAVAFIADEHAGADALVGFASMARAAGALVNVVDQPALCDFTTPSIVDRDPVTVAISTDGAAPVFGRRIRAALEADLSPRAGALALFAEQYRDAVAARIPPAERRAFWERFFAGPIAAQALAGDEAGAHEAMIALINRELPASTASGVVHIVGAGPGDPDLLTLRACRLLQQADVIVYDRLVTDDILALARRDAERIYVGKAKANHATPQDEIEDLLIRLARDGKCVVRLKGGDPFVFGRGGEELDKVRAAGVTVQVTPGITAATGCAAATGMALTHRDHAQAVTFVTGHGKGDADPDLDWSALARLGQTLVVYMGVGKAATIAARLIEHGLSPATPAAVIENGTRIDQRVTKGALADLAALVARGGDGPALLVIGAVAALADDRAICAVASQRRAA